MANIAVIGALDTKGAELAFLRDEIIAHGHAPLVVDVGVLGQPAFAPAISRTDVARTGGFDLATLAADGDRGRAVTAMAEAAREVIVRLFNDGRIDAIIAMGGGAGTTIGTAAM